MSRMLRDYAFQGTTEENQQMHADPQDSLPPQHRSLLQEISSSTQFALNQQQPGTTPSSMRNSSANNNNNNNSHHQHTNNAKSPQQSRQQQQQQQQQSSGDQQQQHVHNAHHSPFNPLRHAKKKRDPPEFIEKVIPPPPPPPSQQNQKDEEGNNNTKKGNNPTPTLQQQQRASSPTLGGKKKSGVRFSQESSSTSPPSAEKSNTSAADQNQESLSPPPESSPHRCTALRHELFATLYDAAKDPASETAPTMLLTSLNRVLELLKEHDGVNNRERDYASKNSSLRNNKNNNNNNNNNKLYTPHRCTVCGGSSAALRNALGMTSLEHSPTLTNSVAVEKFFDVTTPVPDEVFSLLRGIFTRVNKQKNVLVAEIWVKILEYLFIFPAIIQRVLGHAEALSIAFRPTAASQSSLARANRLRLHSLFASDSDEEDEDGDVDGGSAGGGSGRSSGSGGSSSASKHRAKGHHHTSGGAGSDEDDDGSQNVGALPRIETKREYLALVRHVGKTLCRAGLVEFLTELIRDLSQLSQQNGVKSIDVSEDSRIRIAFLIRISSLCEDYFVEQDVERAQTMMKIIMEYHHHPDFSAAHDQHQQHQLPTFSLLLSDDQQQKNNTNQQHRPHYNYATTMELESILQNDLPAPQCSLRGLCLEWIALRLRYAKNLTTSVEMRCLLAAIGVSVSTLSSLAPRPFAGFNPTLNHSQLSSTEIDDDKPQQKQQFSSSFEYLQQQQQKRNSVFSQSASAMNPNQLSVMRNDRRRSRSQSVVAEILLRSQHLSSINNATKNRSIDDKRPGELDAALFEASFHAGAGASTSNRALSLSGTLNPVQQQQHNIIKNDLENDDDDLANNTTQFGITLQNDDSATIDNFSFGGGTNKSGVFGQQQQQLSNASFSQEGQIPQFVVSSDDTSSNQQHVFSLGGGRGLTPKASASGYQQQQQQPANISPLLSPIRPATTKDKKQSAVVNSTLLKEEIIEKHPLIRRLKQQQAKLIKSKSEAGRQAKHLQQHYQHLATQVASTEQFTFCGVPPHPHPSQSLRFSDHEQSQHDLLLFSSFVIRYIKNFISAFDSDDPQVGVTSEAGDLARKQSMARVNRVLHGGRRRSQTMKHFAEHTRLLSLAEAKFLQRLCFAFNHVLSLVRVPSSGSMVGATDIPASGFAPLIQLIILLCDQFHLLRKRNKIRRDRALELELIEKKAWKEAEEEAVRNKELPPPPPLPKKIPDEIQAEDECVNKTIACVVSCAARLIPRPSPTGQFWEAAEPLSEIYNQNNNIGSSSSNSNNDESGNNNNNNNNNQDKSQINTKKDGTNEGGNDQQTSSSPSRPAPVSNKSSDKNFRSTVFSNLTQLVLRGRWSLMRLLPYCPLDAGDLSRLLAALCEEVPWFPRDTNPLHSDVKNIAELVPDRALMTPPPPPSVTANKNTTLPTSMLNNDPSILKTESFVIGGNGAEEDVIVDDQKQNIGTNQELENSLVESYNNTKNPSGESSAAAAAGVGGTTPQNFPHHQNDNTNNLLFETSTNPWATPNVKQLSVTPLLLTPKDTSSQYLLGWQFFCFNGPLKRFSACFSSWTDIETRNMTNQYATSLRHVFNTAQDALKICETCIHLAAKMEKEIVKKNRKRLGIKVDESSSSSPSRFNDDDDDEHTTVDYSLSAASYYTQQQQGSVEGNGRKKKRSALSIVTGLVAEQSESATMIGLMLALQEERADSANKNKNRQEEDDKKNNDDKTSDKKKPSSMASSASSSSNAKLTKEIGGKIINELVSNGLVDVALSVLSLVEKWVAIMEASRHKTISDQLHQQRIRDEIKKMMRAVMRMQKQQEMQNHSGELLETDESDLFEQKEEEEREKKNAQYNPFQSKTIPWFHTESQRIFGLSVRLLSEVAEFSSEARKRILEHKIFSGSLQQLTDRVCATNALATKKLDEHINDRSSLPSSPVLNRKGSSMKMNSNNNGLQKRLDSFMDKITKSNDDNNDDENENNNSNNNINNDTQQQQQRQPSQESNQNPPMIEATSTALNFSDYPGLNNTGISSGTEQQSNQMNNNANAGVSDDGQDVLENTAIMQFLQVRRGYSSALTGHALQRALNSGGMLDRLKLLCEVAPHLANIASSIQQQEEEMLLMSMTSMSTSSAELTTLLKNGGQQLQQQNSHHLQVGFYQTPFFANSVFAVCCLVLHGLPILNPEDPLQDPPLLLQAHEALESVLKALVSLVPEPDVVLSIKKKKKEQKQLSKMMMSGETNQNNNNSNKKKPQKQPDQEEAEMLQSRTTMSLLPIFKLRLLRFQPWYKDLQILSSQLIWKALQTDPDAALCNVITFPHPDDDSQTAEESRKKRASLKNFQKHVKLMHRMKKMESDRVEQAVLIERCLVQFIQLVEKENASRAAVHRRDAAARRRYMVLNEQRAQLDRYLSVDRRGEYLIAEYEEFCRIERLALENIERISRAKNVVPFEALDRHLMTQRRDFLLYEYQYRIQHVYGPESVAWNATKREMMIGLAIVRKHYGRMTDLQQMEFNQRNALIAQQKKRFEQNIAPLWARAVIEATETRKRRIEYDEKWFEGFNKIRREYFNNSLRVFQRFETHCRNKTSREFQTSLKSNIDSHFELLGLQAEEDADRQIMIRLFNAVFHEIAQGWLRIRADWLSVCEKAAREQILIEASEATYGPKHWILPTLRCAAQESSHRLVLAGAEAKERAAFVRAWVWAMQLAVLDEERSVRRNLMVQWAFQANSLAFQRSRGLMEAEETLRRRMEERAYHDELCLIRSASRSSFDSLKAQLQIVLEHQQGANAIDSEEGWLRTGLITLVKERILALKKILREYEKVAAITAKILAEGGEVEPAPTPAQHAARLQQQQQQNSGINNNNTNTNLAASTMSNNNNNNNNEVATNSGAGENNTKTGSARRERAASSLRRERKDTSPTSTSSTTKEKSTRRNSTTTLQQDQTNNSPAASESNTESKQQITTKPKTSALNTSARKASSSPAAAAKRPPSASASSRAK